MLGLVDVLFIFEASEDACTITSREPKSSMYRLETCLDLADCLFNSASCCSDEASC